MGNRIKVKPLSVNKCWQGRRFKTNDYNVYELELLHLLPKLELPIGKLGLWIKLGFSNKASDIDNPIKPVLDILQKKYNFNDKNIYKLNIEKEDVAKGKEYIEFEFSTA